MGEHLLGFTKALGSSGSALHTFTNPNIKDKGSLALSFHQAALTCQPLFLCLTIAFLENLTT